jgi:Protein of unknown function (DUF3499)
MSCSEEPVATISLRYADRRIVIAPLRPQRDPRLLDLCSLHVAGMTPPVGWLVEETRFAAASAARD